jgi:serine/threonine-protein kinase HipA
MERELEVLIERAGTTSRVGLLWARARSARETSSFEYTDTWLRDRERFALDPELPLGAGRFHSERPLFNVFTDPAPDRWGQTLLRRHERARARAERRTARTLLAVDFLTLVDDATRLGALRFRETGSNAFLTVGGRVPPLVQLPRLLRATTAILDDKETDDDLVMLLAPGTSLGGARPKASVRDHDGRLAIAKFPARDDEWPVTRWEAATLAMAAAAEIDVPAARLATVLGKPVLVINRFDRDGDRRLPYMSSLTALSARDGEVRSYLELAENLRATGAAVRLDLEQLWRRVVFNILVSNTDDHLRNHGFLRATGGWRLSPAFDLNPTPVDVRPRMHALAIDETDQSASLETAISIAPAFGLKTREVRTVIREVAASVRKWRTFAGDHGITKRQQDRMASAFDHEDLAAASR